MNCVISKRLCTLVAMPKVGKRRSKTPGDVGDGTTSTPAKISRKENSSGINSTKSCEKSKYFENYKQNADGDKCALKHKATAGPSISKTTTTDPKSDNRTGEKLKLSFYERSCEELAKALLGQTLVSQVDGKRLSGMIVETEAYLGHVDKAAHSYKGKRTPKNEAMFRPPGTAYVYNIYGMYCCINVSSQGDGCAVLIRALEPLENLETMDRLRTNGKPGSSFMKKNGRGLCNGPSKLCQALGIKKDAINLLDLCQSDVIWLEKGDPVDDQDIVKCPRININYAEDWVEKHLRFYVQGNDFISVKYKGN